jgi:2,4-dienoyl-CoA reductase-like NADH-dependent reductase (Old Yellow Enzyme family)
MAMNIGEIQQVTDAFATAAARALSAGFEVIEIHGAHGYLIHEFLSPLANHRTDQYGGSFANRTRFALEVIQAVRKIWPDSLPVFLRISAQDWAEGGWTLNESVELSRLVKPLGVDLIDCSSGGMVPWAKIELGPGYQVPFAARIRNSAGIMTGAVGLITRPDQADSIISGGCADIVLLAREMLRDPNWAIRAAKVMNDSTLQPPVQYSRAWQAP